MLFRHWTLTSTTPADKILIDLEAENESGTDLSSMFEIKKEIAIEDVDHLEYEIMDPYYSLENGLYMGDEDVKDEGKGGHECVGEAGELSVAESPEPSVGEAAEPSVGEAAEPSVGEAAEPSVLEGAEPSSALGDSKPHDHQQPLKGSGTCMTPTASTTKVPFTPTPHDGLSDADIDKRIADLK